MRRRGLGGRSAMVAVAAIAAAAAGTGGALGCGDGGAADGALVDLLGGAAADLRRGDAGAPDLAGPADDLGGADGGDLAVPGGDLAVPGGDLAMSTAFVPYVSTPLPLVALGGSGTVPYAVGPSALCAGTSCAAFAFDAELYGVWGPGGGEVFIAGYQPTGPKSGPTVFHRTSANGAFTATPFDATTRVAHAVWGASAKRIFVVGDGGMLWQTSNGIVFTGKPIGGGTLASVWGSGANDLYVGGATGVLHSTDAATFKPASNGGPVTALSGSGAEVWAVVGSSLAHTTDGKAWAKVSTGIGGGVRAVWAAGPNEAWVVGGPSVGHTVDGGGSFAVTTLAGATLTGVWGSAPATVYLLGTADGGVTRTVWKGP